MDILQHANYLVAKSQLSRALDAAIPGGMIFLIGPSGAGKTTVRHAVFRDVYGPPDKWLRGKIPAIDTVTLLPENSFFSSKALVEQLIREIDAPRARWFSQSHHARSTAAFSSASGEGRNFWESVRKTMREADAWHVLGRLLESRGCTVISLDQVTALLKNRQNKSPTDHTLHLMNFAEMAGVTFLMTGTAEAARLWQIYPELQRRVDIVFVSPYSAFIDGDRRKFANLLGGFQKQFRDVDLKVLLSMDAEILAATGGLVGELERLLVRARNRAHDSGRTHFGRDDLEASYLSKRDLEVLWEGIHAFERCKEAGSVAGRACEIRRVWA